MRRLGDRQNGFSTPALEGVCGCGLGRTRAQRPHAPLAARTLGGVSSSDTLVEFPVGSARMPEGRRNLLIRLGPRPDVVLSCTGRKGGR
jgi:hypothetical protein